MKLLLMADNNVGASIAHWLIKNYRADVSFVVTINQNQIYDYAKNAGIECMACETKELTTENFVKKKIQADLGILAWWPKIIKPELVNFPKYGFINTHPSFLPYNRGKHYNFWAIVEQAPFGVTLHFVGDGIDNGDIVAQKEIAYGWEDNGGSLYQKATKAIVELFKETYPRIRKLQFDNYPQDDTKSTLHYADELENASLINLDRPYKGRDLINLLRARTFDGYPACRFEDDGEMFEVRVNIKKR